MIALLFEVSYAEDMSSKLGIEQEAETAHREALLASMRRDIRDWGVGLLVLGVIHFALAGFLDPIWGAILIAIGVACLIIRERSMYIVIGTALVIVGTMNIAFTGLGGWSILGVFQIGFGIHQVRKFRKYSDARSIT